MKTWWLKYASVDWVIIGSGNGLLRFQHQRWLLANWTHKNFCEISVKTDF